MNQELSQEALKNLKVYTDDGYVFDDKRFEFVNRWTYIFIQLKEAESFLELAINNNKDKTELSLENMYLEQALFRSFVITYAKCFSSSGQGRLTLDKKDIFKNKPDILTTHVKIIEVRNKFVAHSDESGIDIAVLGVKETKSKILIKHTYTISQSSDEYDLFLKVIKVALEAVIAKSNKALDSIQKREGKAVDFK